ncbi:hypothetical protein [Caldimonas sp. KR1-144]|uniref:hypothetical protein n=1 Tax=Caldimonas sp. KR1-144 TaxID=3400911 RepID=UPI003BFAC866
MSPNPRSIDTASPSKPAIQHASHASSLDIPHGHVGPYWLPGTGRLIWWTGRVAIGLRHENAPRADGMSTSEQWVQQLLIDTQPRGWVN